MCTWGCRMRAFRAIRVVAVIAGIAVAGCGGGSSTASKKAAAAKAAKAAEKKAQAEYAKCKSQLSSLMSAEQNLNSHLDVGMNFADYTQAVGNVRAAYGTTPIHQMDQKCLGVGVNLESALNDYVRAVRVWNNCLGKLGCSNASIKPQLQSQWSKASSSITQAQSSLTSLQTATVASVTTPTTPTTSTPTTSTYTSATTPQSSTLPKPTPGESGPPANNSAHTLPAWLGGGKVPQYWLLCGSGSQEVVTNGACGLVIRQVFMTALKASGHPPLKIMDQYDNTYTCKRWRGPGVWRCTNAHDVWGAFTTS